VHKFNTDATAKLVRRLAEHRVPYAFILTGGTEDKFHVDLERARHFKILVGVNPDADFRPIDLKELRSLPVPSVDASRFSDNALRDLSPFVAAGEAIALKLYPRTGVKGDGRNLVIHVIDETNGDQDSSDPSCRSKDRGEEAAHRREEDRCCYLVLGGMGLMDRSAVLLSSSRKP
jgi:hypothetical protein